MPIAAVDLFALLNGLFGVVVVLFGLASLGVIVPLLRQGGEPADSSRSWTSGRGRGASARPASRPEVEPGPGSSVQFLLQPGLRQRTAVRRPGLAGRGDLVQARWDSMAERQRTGRRGRLWTVLGCLVMGPAALLAGGSLITGAVADFRSDAGVATQTWWSTSELEVVPLAFTVGIVLLFGYGAIKLWPGRAYREEVAARSPLAGEPISARWLRAGAVLLLACSIGGLTLVAGQFHFGAVAFEIEEWSEYAGRGHQNDIRMRTTDGATLYMPKTEWARFGPDSLDVRCFRNRLPISGTLTGDCHPMELARR